MKLLWTSPLLSRLKGCFYISLPKKGDFMNKFTKSILTLSAVAAGSALLACAGGFKVKDSESFKNKTGVIGVFRQAAFYCSDVTPQYMTLGNSRIMVKSGWSSEQDNLFVSEMKPGVATLYSYEYACGENENKLVLDTADNGKRAFPIAVKIPDEGFCKVVISFLENDNLFSYNDALLQEQFEKNQVALRADDVPFCEVIDSKGNVVSFVNRDSLNTAHYTTALENAPKLTGDDIYPLVSLEGSSDVATLSGDNTLVLLVTWHNDPDAFKDGETVVLKDKVLWAFTDKEFLKWFNENKDKVSNWSMRLKQLMGKAPDYDGNFFTVFWVPVKDVFRPAFVPDPANGVMNVAFPSSFEEDNSENAMWFKNWFDETKGLAYKRDGGFLWTRLGYTYDWGRTDESKYGLSEFIVKDGAEIEVKFTRSTKGFLSWTKDRK